jgi:hypothetical protein
LTFTTANKVDSTIQAAGDLAQAAADKVWSTAARTLTAGTNIALAKGTGVTGFNDIAAADVWAVGTRTLTAGTNIALAKGTGVTGFNDLSAAQVNAEVDTALADYDAPTSAELVSEINSVQSDIAALNNITAASVWAAGTRTLTASLDPTAAAIADAVWDEVLSGHLGAGSTGEALDGAGGGAPPPTVIEIRQEMDANSTKLANLDVAVSTRGTSTYAGGAVASVTGAVGSVIADVGITQSAADKVLASVVEGTHTLADSARLLNATLGGKSSGHATGSPVYRDIDDTKDRVTATTDPDGNRTAVTTDLT